jgi:CTP-dependent riboflavin kinase
MRLLRGTVRDRRLRDFTRRMTQYADVFRNATGETLIPGTINIELDKPIPIKEQFRIRGVDIGDSKEDFLFEVCRINGFWAYRIRPHELRTGSGGWGDDVLEISSAHEMPNIAPGSEVEIVLFRDDILP